MAYLKTKLKILRTSFDKCKLKKVRNLLFKKWVKSIQTAGYNGARKVHIPN